MKLVGDSDSSVVFILKESMSYSMLIFGYVPIEFDFTTSGMTG